MDLQDFNYYEANDFDLNFANDFLISEDFPQPSIFDGLGSSYFDLNMSLNSIDKTFEKLDWEEMIKSLEQPPSEENTKRDLIKEIQETKMKRKHKKLLRKIEIAIKEISKEEKEFSTLDNPKAPLCIKRYCHHNAFRPKTRRAIASAFCPYHKEQLRYKRVRLDTLKFAEKNFNKVSL